MRSAEEEEDQDTVQSGCPRSYVALSRVRKEKCCSEKPGRFEIGD